jgi:antitoxin component of MazEF toxin-antitoxin module
MARERTRVLGQRGGSLGITLPPVILKALNLKAGDRLEVRLRSSIIEIARAIPTGPESRA